MSGEKFWRLPCTSDYKDEIKSQIADMMNTGATRYGGATSAAMFLAEFADGTPWISSRYRGHGVDRRAKAVDRQGTIRNRSTLDR